MNRLFSTILVLLLTLVIFGVPTRAQVMAADKIGLYEGEMTIPSAAQATPEPALDSGESTGTFAVQQDAQAASSAAAGMVLTKTFAGHDFRPRSSDCGFEYYSSGGIYANSFDTNIENNVFVVKLDLPAGAQVTQVTFYFIDNAGGSLDFFLTSYNPTGSFVNRIMMTSTGSPQNTTVQTKVWALTPITIDSNLSYSLRFVPDSATNAEVIMGARVVYSIDSVWLPAVNR